MGKIKCAIVGSGNIGTDLISKLRRSAVLEPVWVAGIDPHSEGLARARALGLKTTAEGVDGLLPHVKEDRVQIVFDATSAYVHAENLRKLKGLGVMMIDLTPAAIGSLCVPTVNLAGLSEKRVMNISMISATGQATIPIVGAISRIQSVAYAEVIANLSACSLGQGTRANLDESNRTTSNAMCAVGGAKRGKALIILDAADPAMIMRNTIYCLTEDDPDRVRITESILGMIDEVQKYVPGLRMTNGPVFGIKCVAMATQVEGLGDYLPKYAGNLDIMTASATRTAERFAEQWLSGPVVSKLAEVVS